MAFTTLAHHIDIDFLKAAHRAVRKDGAPGIDGQGAKEYAEDLEVNLQSLLDRFKSGRYRAPAVRRVHIPKGKGSQTRPIGIPTFEDKVLQKAVAMVLEAIYEQDFRDCSYGFRPGRSAHQALQRLWEGTMKMGGGWVVDLDIEGFFEALDHRILRSLLDQRVRDGVLRRVIHKWLKAGALENGQQRRAKSGTPQGGVISPLLANIYLHHVIDVWFEEQVRPCLFGRGFLVRYADDLVIVLSREDDARRLMEVLPKRLGRFGLRPHPEKTRLVRFARPRGPANRSDASGARPGVRPGTFDFLGFTHFWGKSRKGRSVVKRKTASDRQRRAVRNVNLWLKRHRHGRIADQHRALSRKIRGHCAYYGLTGNSQRLSAFHYQVRRLWLKWLNRRSQRSNLNWERFQRLLQRYPLPPPVVIHSIYRPAANP
jgi:group II intron reverse transcriptase/maturase